jgi:hypothetical protein
MATVIYGRVLDAIDVERFEFSPDGGLYIVQYLFRTHLIVRERCSFNGPSRPICALAGTRTMSGSGMVGILPSGADQGVFVAQDADHLVLRLGALPSKDASNGHPSSSHEGPRRVAASSHIVTVAAHSDHADICRLWIDHRPERCCR